MSAPSRSRLDAALARAGLAESSSQAQALILAGQVRVGGETVRSPDRQVRSNDLLEVVAPPRFVSRGGEKLEPALDELGIAVTGRICADIGASTGGFTDALLQKGAARVYAIDVGRGLMHWRLRQDPRVVLMERVNARHLVSLPEAVSLVTVDVSFIGLAQVLPALGGVAPGADFVVLFKPQFEVRRAEVGKGGVVRDPAAVEAALARFREWCAGSRFDVRGESWSSVTGAEGNRELFMHLVGPGGDRT
jgi:23S rRNA (cytidine1920-2'-O)/16S rRNA (cytidine1409-2'-O)-methyltransferase